MADRRVYEAAVTDSTQVFVSQALLLLTRTIWTLLAVFLVGSTPVGATEVLEGVAEAERWAGVTASLPEHEDRGLREEPVSTGEGEETEGEDGPPSETARALPSDAWYLLDGFERLTRRPVDVPPMWCGMPWHLAALGDLVQPRGPPAGPTV